MGIRYHATNEEEIKHTENNPNQKLRHSGTDVVTQGRAPIRLIPGGTVVGESDRQPWKCDLWGRYRFLLNCSLCWQHRCSEDLHLTSVVYDDQETRSYVAIQLSGGGLKRELDINSVQRARWPKENSNVQCKNVLHLTGISCSARVPGAVFVSLKSLGLTLLSSPIHISQSIPDLPQQKDSGRLRWKWVSNSLSFYNGNIPEENGTAKTWKTKSARGS